MSMKRNRTWKDIKLRQLQELHELPEFTDKIDMMVNYLSILLDTDPSDIEDMAVSDLIQEFERWDFLKEIPEEKSVPVIKLNKKRFGLVKFNKMSFAQLVDVEEYINDGGIIKNLHKILATIYLPIKSYNPITKKYTLEKYEPSEETAEGFLNLDMALLYPVTLFFYHIVQDYLKNLVSSLVQTKSLNLKEKILKEAELSQVQKRMLLTKLEELGTGMV